MKKFSEYMEKYGNIVNESKNDIPLDLKVTVMKHQVDMLLKDVEFISDNIISGLTSRSNEITKYLTSLSKDLQELSMKLKNK